MESATQSAGRAVYLSVVIPMYREAARIGKTLESTQAWLEKQTFTSEIVLVNDGSPDNTAEVVQTFLHDEPRGSLGTTKLVSYTINRGKGCAVRTGLASCQGELALMMDADNAARVDQVEKLLPDALPGVGIVAGSREADDAQVEAVPMRRLTGFLFRVCLRTMGLALIRDTQCGFKLYSRDAIEVMNAYAKEDGYVFDLEHLRLTQMAGLEITERGVEWEHVEGGQVSAVSDGLKMLRASWKLRSRLQKLDVQLPSAGEAASAVELKPSRVTTSGAA